MKVQFEPEVIGLARLIDIHLHTHASTSQHSMRAKYRSAIYVNSPQQAHEAKAILSEIQDDFSEPLVTRVLPLVGFKLSEPGRRAYFEKNNGNQFCERYIEPKLKKLRDEYPDVAACMNEAARVRYRFRLSLGTGKMLRPPVVEGVPWRDVAMKDVAPRKWPAILAGHFRSTGRDRQAVVVLANWTREQQSGILRVDLTELSHPVRAIRLGGERIGTFEGDQMSVPIDLPAASVEAVVLQYAQ